MTQEAARGTIAALDISYTVPDAFPFGRDLYLSVRGTQGVISWGLSLAAVGGGIALVDVGLYGLGLAATRVPWLQRRYLRGRSDWVRDRLNAGLPMAVLLARVIPGLRLV